MLEATPNTVSPRFESSNVPSGAEAVDRAIRGGSFQSLAAEAHLPYQDRCAYVDIPELALRGKPPMKPQEVWDSFSKDFAPVKDFFTCIQMVRPNRLRVWCPSSTVLEDVLNTGLTLRDHPLRIRPIIDRCWLTVTHLPYGLSEQAIRQFFEDFGEVRAIRFVQYRQVFTGTIKVLMNLQKTIPTRIRILGHAGLVYHPGQVRTCFHCGATGHESKSCPGKKTSSPKPGKKKRSPKKKTTAKKTNQQSSQSSRPEQKSTESNLSTPTSDSTHNVSIGEATPATPTNKPSPSTTVHNDDDHETEVFSSPKGTWDPPIPEVDTQTEQNRGTASKEETPAFLEPPHVDRTLSTSRKTVRRKNTDPPIFGLDYGSPKFALGKT